MLTVYTLLIYIKRGQKSLKFKNMQKKRHYFMHFLARGI